MSRLLLRYFALFALIAGLLTPLPAAAQPVEPTIAIDFDFEGRASGYAVRKSSFTVEERAMIVKLVQGEYDEAFGPGVITVGEGNKGKVVIVVNGVPHKKGATYNFAGTSGRPGKPGVVWERAFHDYSRAELIIAIEETIAHEAAHKLGRNGHNHNKDDPSKMTDGTLVPDETRKKGGRKFTKEDVEAIKQALNLITPEQKDAFMPRDLGIWRGERILDPEAAGIPDEQSLEAYVTLDLPADHRFGFISFGGDFISLTGDDGRLFGDTLSFFHTSGQDMALLTPDGLCTLSSGCGRFTLSGRNPDFWPVFQQAHLLFSTAYGPVSVHLDASVWRTTGGFTAFDPALIPEPATWMMWIAGFGIMGGFLRHRPRAVGRSRAVA